MLLSCHSEYSLYTFAGITLGLSLIDLLKRIELDELVKGELTFLVIIKQCGKEELRYGIAFDNADQ